MSNRDVILNKAIELFSIYSFEVVGIQRIVEESGITKPTLYYYFGSKKGLMECILETHIGDYLENLKLKAEYQGHVMETLSHIAEYVGTYSSDRPEIFRLYKSMSAMPLESESGKLVSEYKEREDRIYQDLFEKIGEDHGNIRGRYPVYSMTFKGLLDTYVGMLASGFQYDEEDLLYRVLHQFLHGIYS